MEDPPEGGLGWANHGWLRVAAQLGRVIGQWVKMGICRVSVRMYYVWSLVGGTQIESRLWLMSGGLWDEASLNASELEINIGHEILHPARGMDPCR